MAPQRSANQFSIPARFTKQTIDRMDTLIRNGEYSSRSALIKTAVENLLNEGRAREEARKAIRDEIATGSYDDLIEDRLRTILARVIIPNPETKS